MFDFHTEATKLHQTLFMWVEVSFNVTVTELTVDGASSEFDVVCRYLGVNHHMSRLLHNQGELLDNLINRSENLTMYFYSLTYQLKTCSMLRQMRESTLSQTLHCIINFQSPLFRLKLKFLFLHYQLAYKNLPNLRIVWANSFNSFMPHQGIKERHLLIEFSVCLSVIQLFSLSIPILSWGKFQSV